MVCLENQSTLEHISVTRWAGLGAVRYIPVPWKGVQSSNDLPDSGKEEINDINKNIVSHLRNMDAAFSKGKLGLNIAVLVL